MPSPRRVILVGADVAGSACAMKLAEEGVHVDLFSLAAPGHANSANSRSGINAANAIARQQGYSQWSHFDETVLGGDFLADQPPVHEMCEWAPRIVDLLDRMGVPFDRTAEGQRALRLMDGSLVKRNFFAGNRTAQLTLSALDQQVVRRAADGLVTQYPYWEFLAPVIHDGDGSPVCAGIVAQDLRSMQVRAFAADAVVMATGDYAAIFGSATASLSSTGSAIARCYRAGAKCANLEFIQSHPACVAGVDKSRVAGDCGRVWTTRINDKRSIGSIAESERRYFLEELYPEYRAQIPRDIAAREIARCAHEGPVYLDRQGQEAIPIAPAVHCGLGGLWVSFKKDEKTGGLKAGDPANLSTNIAGLYAIGDANFAYHGANRLGGNHLLACVFDGLFGASCIKTYCTEMAGGDAPQSAFDSAIRQENQRIEQWLAGDGSENPHLLNEEIGRWMSEHCGVVRLNDKLELALARCKEWKRRYKQIAVVDKSSWANQVLPAARASGDRIVLAEMILKGALLRNESRGAHFKPSYPERDDANYLKATICTRDRSGDSPVVRYEPVDTSLIAPRARTYGRTPEAQPAKTDRTTPSFAAKAPIVGSA